MLIDVCRSIDIYGVVNLSWCNILRASPNMEWLCLAFEILNASLKSWYAGGCGEKNSNLRYLSEWYTGSYHKVTLEKVKDDAT
jgi:hypothetical protein